MTPPIDPFAGSVLVADTDGDWCAEIAAYLREHGYVVYLAADAAAESCALDEVPIDLVVRDVSLPGEDGLLFCRSMSEEHGAPVILLGAQVDEADRILGLELGAAAVLPKTVSNREILARIRAILRRAWLGRQAHEAQVGLRPRSAEGSHTSRAKRR